MGIGRRGFFQRLTSLVTVAVLPGKTMALIQPTDELVDLPPENEMWLDEWRSAKRLPICDSNDATERRLLRALRRQEPVEFVYHGGTTPGARRRVQPAMLYRVEGFPMVYLTGYCELQKEIRTFRLDRIRFPTA